MDTGVVFDMEMKNVVDTKNTSYEIQAKLGEGSQGVTYYLKGKKYIVKLFKTTLDDNSIKSKINFLINLDLDKKKFAVPLRQITQPKNGYISEFASGMIPLSELKLQSNNANIAEWYNSSGGLLKRYKVLIKLASLLRVLHSKGLIYCDLSPNNVFVSEKSDLDNVFLIDLDNLRYKTSIVNNIYTPFYGAPEVIANKAPNTAMSDCFSFAIIAYELLTLNHPLIGDYVSDGDPELEEKALEGNLPWVDHSEDSINERSTGLPTKNVIPQKLLNMFRKNFEAGLNDTFERPTMAEWHDVLILALNELLQCGNCGMQYPYNNFKHCPFCNYEPQKVTRIQMRRWEEVEFFDKETQIVKQQFLLQQEIYEEILIDENTSHEIMAGNFLLSNTDPLSKILEIKYLIEKNEHKILLTPLNGFKFNISPRVIMAENHKTIEMQSPQKIRIVDANQQDKLKYMIHIHDLNTPQRVLTID